MVAHVEGLERASHPHVRRPAIYRNTSAQVRELLSREPLSFRVSKSATDRHELPASKVCSTSVRAPDLVGYKSHSKIEAPVAV